MPWMLRVFSINQLTLSATWHGTGKACVRWEQMVLHMYVLNAFNACPALFANFMNTIEYICQFWTKYNFYCSWEMTQYSPNQGMRHEDARRCGTQWHPSLLQNNKQKGHEPQETPMHMSWTSQSFLVIRGFKITLLWLNCSWSHPLGNLNWWPCCCSLPREGSQRCMSLSLERGLVQIHLLPNKMRCLKHGVYVSWKFDEFHLIWSNLWVRQHQSQVKSAEGKEPQVWHLWLSQTRHPQNRNWEVSPKPELVSSKCRIFPGGSVFVDSFCGAGGSMAQREGQVGMEGYVL